MTQDVARPSYWSSIVIGVVVVIAVIAYLIITVSWADAYGSTQQILDRYIDQLHAGNGLVFNPGERVLLVASPMYLLMVAVLRVVTSTTAADAILFTIAALVGAFSLKRIARQAELRESSSILLAVFFFIVSVFESMLLTFFDPSVYVAFVFALITLA